MDIILGMKWQGELYIDTALPFGLRSAPKLFTAIADDMQWILQKLGSYELTHYSDNFCLYIGVSGTEKCLESLQMAEDTHT